MSIFGFTGTRYGMTKMQARSFIELLEKYKPQEFHHGRCIGADAEAHQIVRGLFPECKIVIHPPLKKEHEAKECVGDEMMPEKGHLTRNQNIVKAVNILVATPKEFTEQTRGGTWFTLRYSEKRKLPRCIILPDGFIKFRGFKEESRI